MKKLMEKDFVARVAGFDAAYWLRAHKSTLEGIIFECKQGAGRLDAKDPLGDRLVVLADQLERVTKTIKV